MSDRIGIFAGTFDPVHEGHLDFAQAALRAGLTKVYFLVEPRPRRKQGVRALEHRQAMVKLAIAREPRFSQVILEQARFSPDETLPALQERFKGYELVLLFGDDVLAHIAHWPHVEALVASVQLLIAVRHADQTAALERMKSLEKTRHLRFRYNFLTVEHSTVSSSRIRLALKRGQTVHGLQLKVENYIKRAGLYISDKAGS